MYQVFEHPLTSLVLIYQRLQNYLCCKKLDDFYILHYHCTYICIVAFSKSGPENLIPASSVSRTYVCLSHAKYELISQGIPHWRSAAPLFPPPTTAKKWKSRAAVRAANWTVSIAPLENWVMIQWVTRYAAKSAASLLRHQNCTEIS